jgi:hypothetical protein
MKKLISIFLLLVATTASAQNAATVLYTSQKVSAEKAGVERTITRGSILAVGDAISTAAGATARLRYFNGTMVTLGADSTYKIMEYAPDQDVVINASLNRGKMESETDNGPKREKLNTPVVAMAVIGTKYNVLVSSDVKNNVRVIEGMIEAGGRLWGPGESFVATPEGVSEAPFPNEGIVEISAEMEAATEEAIGVAGGDSLSSIAGDIEFLSTTIIVGESVASDTGASTLLDAPLATIEITSCLPGTI